MSAISSYWLFVFPSSEITSVRAHLKICFRQLYSLHKTLKRAVVEESPDSICKTDGTDRLVRLPFLSFMLQFQTPPTLLRIFPVISLISNGIFEKTTSGQVERHATPLHIQYTIIPSKATRFLTAQLRLDVQSVYIDIFHTAQGASEPSEF